ncbi:uncharacterized protein LOC136009112 [Lathamus discolor]|uniref:uncharacterized protein LOC136009112 n=1 Tax=Lathamus discolor TaxID=678569 RepID=UPI0032B73B74
MTVYAKKQRSKTSGPNQSRHLRSILGQEQYPHPAKSGGEREEGRRRRGTCGSSSSRCLLDPGLPRWHSSEALTVACSPEHDQPTILTQEVSLQTSLNSVKRHVSERYKLTENHSLGYDQDEQRHVIRIHIVPVVKEGKLATMEELKPEKHPLHKRRFNIDVRDKVCSAAPYQATSRYNFASSPLQVASIFIDPQLQKEKDKRSGII